MIRRKPSESFDPPPPPAPPSPTFALWAPISPVKNAGLAPPPTFTRGPDLVIPADAVLHAVAKCRWCGSQFRQIEDGAHWLCVSEACATRQLDAAVDHPHATNYQTRHLYIPLPVQVDIEEHPARHLLVAGAAGVSKSYGARWSLYKLCRQVEGLRAIILRATYPELERGHLQFMSREAQLLGDARYVGFQTREMRFSNGSVIFGGSCDDDRAISRHLGAEFDIMVLDEASTFSARAVNELIPRARGSQPARAAMKALGLSPRTRCVSNPGGKAALYLIDHYIRREPDREEYPAYQADNYAYITATLEDNPFLAPDYEKTELSGLSAARYKQLRYGDWTSVAGQYFSEFCEELHITEDPNRSIPVGR
jgi:hypothetical protein